MAHDHFWTTLDPKKAHKGASMSYMSSKQFLCCYKQEYDQHRHATVEELKYRHHTILLHQ